MALSEGGAKLLRDRPLITEDSIHFTRLRGMPEGSFGRSYMSWMDLYGYSPNSRKEVMYVDDTELAYVMQRYRQVHDFWHVLVDLPPTVSGEIALKWFEMVQTGLPMTVVASLVGPMRLSLFDNAMLVRKYIPWALKAGKEAEYLLSQRYEDLFHLPLQEVRQALKIQTAPSLK